MHRLAALWDEAEQGDGRLLPMRVDEALDAPGWDDADRAWAVAWLMGRRSARLLDSRALRALALEATGHPAWLLDECLAAGSDAAELLAHAGPSAPVPPRPLAPSAAAALLAAWRAMAPAARPGAIAAALADRDAPTRLLLLRLATGSRLALLPVAALRDRLAHRAGVEPHRMALRLQRLLDPAVLPDGDGWRRLMQPVRAGSGDADPESAELPLVPPYLAPVQDPPDGDGPWLALPLRGAQRVQVVRHARGVRVWTARGDLVEDLHPALARGVETWPVGTVVEGELGPAGLVAIDLLRLAGNDLRGRPWPERWSRLPQPGPGEAGWTVGEAWSLPSTGELLARHAGLRAAGGRSLRFAPLQRAPGPMAGESVEWPAEALVLRTVLVYVESRRHGPPACELALWSRAPADAAEAAACADAMAAAAASGRAPAAAGRTQDLLLQPLARTDAGLDPDDRQRLADVVAATAVQRFGPVTALRPTLVVELAFDAVVAQPRRRSRLGVDAPRMRRLRPDLPIEAADTVATAAAWAAAGTG